MQTEEVVLNMSPCCKCHRDPVLSKKQKVFLYLAVLVLVGLNIADLSAGVVMRHELAEVGKQGRQLITEGFLPKIVHALKVAHEDQHHAPLHNILGGVGDVISSWFSSPKAKGNEIQTNDIRSFSRGRRDVIREKNLPDIGKCEFNENKFMAWFDTLPFERQDSVLDVLFLMNMTLSAQLV